jgi:dynein heavy chain
VLVQELQRFNTLLALITASLADLLKTLSGESVASEATEALYHSVYRGEVPARWREASYPMVGTLAAYAADLRRRLATFEAWASEGPPAVYWLPGFYSPQAFLTALLQGRARREYIDIDQLYFRMTFRERQPEDGRPDSPESLEAVLPTAPIEGALVRGLFLEGAAWSRGGGCLQEQATGELLVQMPDIHLIPTALSELATTAPAAEPYACPLYRTPARRGTLSTTGHSTNFVRYFDLPSGDRPPAHWIKRGAALLCQAPG